MKIKCCELFFYQNVNVLIDLKFTLLRNQQTYTQARTTKGNTFP